MKKFNFNLQSTPPDTPAEELSFTKFMFDHSFDLDRKMVLRQALYRDFAPNPHTKEALGHIEPFAFHNSFDEEEQQIGSARGYNITINKDEEIFYSKEETEDLTNESYYQGYVVGYDDGLQEGMGVGFNNGYSDGVRDANQGV